MNTGTDRFCQKSMAKPVWYLASEVATNIVTPSADSRPATHMRYRPATRPAAR